MIYTKQATQRIFAKTKELYIEVLSLDIWDKVVRITYQIGAKKASTLISKKLYLKEFADFRKEGSKDYHVLPGRKPGEYKTLVKNSARDNHFNKSFSAVYAQTCTPNQITCNCGDYAAQRLKFGKGMCKHGYAVLNHLGFSTLEEYKNKLSRRFA